MEWRHSCSPLPKTFRVQKSAGKILASIFWDQDGFLLSDYLPKGQTIITEYYWSLLVQLKDILKKNAAGISRRGSCSFTTMPRFAGHLQRRRNWPTFVSNVLITHLILRIWPRRTTTRSLDWKKQSKRRHFSSDAEIISCLGDLVGRTTFWILFEWLAKVRATG